jgi:Zinc-finger of C2H2 type
MRNQKRKASTMDQNKCNVCNQTFNSENELREHQRNAHAGKREQGPGSETNQDSGEKRIAS